VGCALVEEGALSVAGAEEREVDVPALARERGVPLRHEGREEPAPLRPDLREGLEQGGPIRRLADLRDTERGLPHTRPGLGVQPLDGTSERLHRRHELVVGLGVDAAPQHRVPEHARRERHEIAVALRADRLGRLLEEEELVFERAEDVVPERGGARRDAREEAATAGPRVVPGELPEEQHRVRFEWDAPQRLEIELHGRVAVAGVPPGDRRVVVEHVGAVPADHDVAEAEALLGARQELRSLDVFATQHAVDVRHRHLVAANPVLIEPRLQLVDRLQPLHRISCCSVRRTGRFEQEVTRPCA
jgi:hypothetical protein